MPVVPENQRTPCGAIAAGALLLCCVTVIAYLPALRSGFIWDDDLLVTGNNLLKSASGLHKIWFTTEPSDYWPVTLTAFWVQWHLWGLNAMGYHAVNVALHIVEALFLWAILRRLRIPGAFLGAFLFAVHPVNVETVAWISELKNLTAMLFFLASIWFFLGAEEVAQALATAERSGDGSLPAVVENAGGTPALLLSLLCFTLGMLSKGSVAILPLILLGIIRWHRRIDRRDLIRLAPFFVVSAVLVAVDVWFQRHGTAEVIRTAGFLDRLPGAGAVIWFYLGKALWPGNLVFVYPEWHIRAADPRWWIPLLAAVGVTVALWRSRLPWSRAMLFAWGFFCVSLLPVMGFADVYFMRYSLVADHYQHIAITGVVGLVAAGWSGCAVAQAGRWKVGLQIVAAVVIGILACLTWRQCENYRDPKTLYMATLEKNPDAWIAHTNLGVILLGEGRLQEAIDHYNTALRLKPDLADADLDMGIALAESGRTQAGIAYLEKAVLLKPDSYQTRYNLGLALIASRRFPEAIFHFERVLRLKPDYLLTDFNLADALVAVGRTQDAVAHYEKALSLRPDFPKAQNDLGDALTQLGRLSQAVTHYEEAVRLRPDYAEAHENLGAALGQLGKESQAVQEFTVASRLQPGDPAIHNNLGCALAQLGRNSEARSEFEEALRLKPDDADARSNLARLPSAQPTP
jgi:protein O-mannosyl-transferase